MSHHDSEHGLDCADVIEAVYLYLDGELSGEVISAISGHLDECAPCLREYGVEQEVKALIARSCCETAPESLKASVIQRLEVVRAELGTSGGYTEVSITEITRTEFRTD